MNNNLYFDEKQIIAMNIYKTKIVIEKKEDNDLYHLYPTGNIDINGREFIALPMNIDIKNPEIKQKYNLI